MKKEWTIMIYMAGDNNLAVDMAYAMEQIKGVAADSEESPNLLVYYDGNSPAIPTMYCDFSEPERPRYVRSYKVTDKLIEVDSKINENAADTKSILNFVDWCVNKVKVEKNGRVTRGRRAEKYALIFSGHSLGFQDIGLFRDETSGKSLKMRQFYDTLQTMISTKEELIEDAKANGVLKEDMEVETTVLLGKKLDILGFDSCVMGMLEVGYQFSTVAKTMIASEGSVPSAGWTYTKLLGSLAREQNKDLDTRGVAALFVREFIRSQDAYTVGGVSVDMAAWDMKHVSKVADVFDELSEELIECFEEPGSRLYRQMERIILKVHWGCQSYMYDQNVDLGDFCQLLERECGMVADELGESKDAKRLEKVQKKCRDLTRALRKAVILSGFSGGVYQHSHGMSVFFPWSRQGYEVSKKNYEGLWFAKDVKRKKLSWSDFLKKYLYQVSVRKFELEDFVERYIYPSGVKFADGDGDDEVYAYTVGVTKVIDTGELQVIGKEVAVMGQAAFQGAAQGGSKIMGQEGSKIMGQEGSKIMDQEGSKIMGQEGSKIMGQEGSKIMGQEGSKIMGQEGSKIMGQEGSKIMGQEGSKIMGQEGSKIMGQEGSKIMGQEGSKIMGQEGSKIMGQEGSKIMGQEGSKIMGQEGSKIMGQEGSKIMGQEGSKIFGQEGSKLAGGGGGAGAFLSSLQLFKNVETRWDVSGFTKDPDNPDGDDKD